VRTLQGVAPKGKLAVHLVGQGDTLYRLAAKYYGDSTRWKLIQDANPGLPNGGVKGLRLGTELVIPAVPEQGR
jgi:nucleoid-associated protein YgaU